ncbi:MAG: polysaccharide deacetylase family protein [Flavisolibacter sp.]|nr:polysaccharide deacetylase family protein [Flavisolibacter sp.]
MKQKILFSLIFLFTITDITVAQIDTTYAERLGFPKGKKVVILHVDDAGMSYDSDLGAMEALTKGVATSCSVMMPCPWVPHFVHFLQQHPQIDAGLHLTLTSEWKEYRWVPLSGKPSVPGLVDKEGALWPSVEEVVKNATPDEVETEIKAQIERAKAMGFQPTHLDSHMGTLFASPAFLQRYLKAGLTNNIPVMFPGGHNTLIGKQTKASESLLTSFRQTGKMIWQSGLPVLDDLHNESYNWQLPAGMIKTKENIQKSKAQYYMDALKSLKPGITMVIMHCTKPTEVFPFISNSGTTREGDLLAMLDPALKAYIEKEGIILTTWRELMVRRQKIK